MRRKERRKRKRKRRKRRRKRRRRRRSDVVSQSRPSLTPRSPRYICLIDIWVHREYQTIGRAVFLLKTFSRNCEIVNIHL